MAAATNEASEFEGRDVGGIEEGCGEWVGGWVRRGGGEEGVWGIESVQKRGREICPLASRHVRAIAKACRVLSAAIVATW